jgi:phosphoribosylanthranilate isomerase
MIVQIYEISNPKEGINLAELGVDHIGVLVGKGEYPREINPMYAKTIFESLPEETKRVTLSLSHHFGIISQTVRETKPDILHLGALPELLSPNDVRNLKKEFPNLKIMRSIPVIDEMSIEVAKDYEGIADYLLLDTHQEGDNQIGATGRVHDWNLSRRITDSINIPVILAGGLGPENVAEAIQIVKPKGVDSKTKTDRPDGKAKDIEKVKLFVEIAKSLLYNHSSAD